MEYYYDLHIHSALSPCGDADMTPNNIVNMSKLNGLDIIALTDHNSCANVRATEKVASKAGLIFLPGMELETAEEIHVLCLFSDVESAERFDNDQVRPALPQIKNNEEIFGRQQILDENDEETGTDPRYLINATSITIDKVSDLVCGYGGIAIPAHIDKSTKSLISVLGMIDKNMGFNLLELSVNAPEDYIKTQSFLRDENYFYMYNSDAHYLENISENNGKNFLRYDEPALTASKVMEFLKNKL